MSCCGRRPPIPASIQPGRPAPGMTPMPLPVRAADVPFVYTGATRLVADGPVTHRRYRFEQPGAQVDVDARDAPSFAAIPNLRRATRR